MTVDLDELQRMIEEKRSILNGYGEKKNLEVSELLKVSLELDELIVSYTALCSAVRKS
ncbi:Spo0E family sporulation regulatory protein-aspartic acid phosphatase [Paenibacillus sp. SI8]|uniref:Spo0E family sporulation regulatory protein-aspartic acid phosphatase n=1 Tax=unclassified Paenibacillus TaxID=185978 RepID=UPI003465572D